MFADFNVRNMERKYFRDLNWNKKGKTLGFSLIIVIGYDFQESY